MPARIASQQTATSARVRAEGDTQSLASGNSRDDEWGPNGTWTSPTTTHKGVSSFTDIDCVTEPLSRNRLQKKPSKPSVQVGSASFLPVTDPNVCSNNAQSQSRTRNRKGQLTIQNQQGPMGPRPLGGSMRRRYEEIHDLKLHPHT